MSPNECIQYIQTGFRKGSRVVHAIDYAMQFFSPCNPARFSEEDYTACSDRPRRAGLTEALTVHIVSCFYRPLVTLGSVNTTYEFCGGVAGGFASPGKVTFGPLP